MCQVFAASALPECVAADLVVKCDANLAAQVLSSFESPKAYVCFHSIHFRSFFAGICLLRYFSTGDLQGLRVGWYPADTADA
jgi:hypothetical protein